MSSGSTDSLHLARNRSRSRLWARLRYWAIIVTITGGIVAAGFIPYPYETGGPFFLLPVARTEVRSSIEGLVEKVLVREGQWVETGQLIARLSPRVQERNLKATEGQLDEARAQLRLLRAGTKPEEIERAQAAVRTAEAALNWSQPRAARYAGVYAQKLISIQEYENAVRQQDMDRQALAEAQANLEVVRSGARPEQVEALEAQVRSLQALKDNYASDLQHTMITAPAAGRIVTPRVEELEGTYLQPGQRDLVVEIEDARTIRAEVEVPEEDVSGVYVGAPMKLVAWAFHDRMIRGTVIAIAPVAATAAADGGGATVAGGATRGTTQVAVSNSKDRSVRVVTEIPNPDGLLKSDLTGYAKIASGKRPVWNVLLRPIIRWFAVEFWYWLP